MLKKILLACSLIAFAIGFSDVGEASQWGLALPLGAVCFILFFIVTVLEKESALYDAEQRELPASPKPAPREQSVAHRGWQTS